MIEVLLQQVHQISNAHKSAFHPTMNHLCYPDGYPCVILLNVQKRDGIGNWKAPPVIMIQVGNSTCRSVTCKFPSSFEIIFNGKGSRPMISNIGKLLRMT